MGLYAVNSEGSSNKTRVVRLWRLVAAFSWLKFLLIYIASDV